MCPKHELKDLIVDGKYDEAWNLYKETKDISLLEEFLYIIKYERNEDIVYKFIHKIFLECLFNEGKVNIEVIGPVLMYCSCKFDHLPAIKYLFQKGIKNTAFKILPITVASQNGRIHIIEFLLEQNGNAESDLQIVLDYSCKYRHFDAVQYIIKKNKNLKVENAFFYAIFCDSLEIVKYLIENMHVEDRLLVLGYDRAEVLGAKVISYLLQVIEERGPPHEIFEKRLCY